MNREIISKNGTANTLRPYRISQNQKLFIVAIPEKESFNTTYEFEYWTDAMEKVPVYQQLIKKYENIDEKGRIMIYIACGCVLCLICLLCTCCCVFMKSRKDGTLKVQ